MEIKAENYLINYYANSSDFRIIIYNNITTKKYETIKTPDDYKMYKDIGLDIFEIIKNCLDNNTFTINDSNDYLTLLLTYKELIKISINCDNLRIDKKEIELFDLKNDIHELKNIIKNQNTILEKLKPYYEVVSIDNNTFHKDIQEIHVNKLTQTYEKDYWDGIDSSKLLIPVIYNSAYPKCIFSYKVNIINENVYSNNQTTFTSSGVHYIMLKTPQFRKYHKYPEIPKIYFSDTIKIKELTDNLHNLNFIGLSYFDISHDDIENLLNLKKLTKIKFYKCNFINITQEKIIIMLGGTRRIGAIFIL
jgi:hypothetical protein